MTADTSVAAQSKRAIEALVMVAEAPIEPQMLAQLLELAPARIEALCAELAAEYDAEERGYQLVRVAGGYRYQSHPDQSVYVERFVLEGQASRLSAAALETLAIVAYKQPVSRAQIAAIRGVNVDGVVRTLQQRGIIDEVGHDPGPGQAALYGTSRTFLERLGLDSIADLPPLGQFVPGPEVLEALETGLRPEVDVPLGDTDDAAPRPEVDIDLTEPASASGSAFALRWTSDAPQDEGDAPNPAVDGPVDEQAAPSPAEAVTDADAPVRAGTETGTGTDSRRPPEPAPDSTDHATTAADVPPTGGQPIDTGHDDDEGRDEPLGTDGERPAPSLGRVGERSETIAPAWGTPVWSVSVRLPAPADELEPASPAVDTSERPAEPGGPPSATTEVAPQPPSDRPTTAGDDLGERPKVEPAGKAGPSGRIGLGGDEEAGSTPPGAPAASRTPSDSSRDPASRDGSAPGSGDYGP
jgi:segregation and condensation protein B